MVTTCVPPAFHILLTQVLVSMIMTIQCFCPLLPFQTSLHLSYSSYSHACFPSLEHDWDLP